MSGAIPDSYACVHKVPWAHRCIHCESDTALRAEVASLTTELAHARENQAASHAMWNEGLLQLASQRAEYEAALALATDTVRDQSIDLRAQLATEKAQTLKYQTALAREEAAHAATREELTAARLDALAAFAKLEARAERAEAQLAELKEALKKDPPCDAHAGQRRACGQCHDSLAAHVRDLRAQVENMQATLCDLSAAFDARGAQVKRLTAALRNLTERIEEVSAHPRYRAVWECAQLHLGQYEGPLYEAALDEATEVLKEKS